MKSLLKTGVVLLALGCENPELSYTQLAQLPGGDAGKPLSSEGATDDTVSVVIETTDGLVVEPPTSSNDTRDAATGDTSEGLSNAPQDASGTHGSEAGVEPSVSEPDAGGGVNSVENTSVGDSTVDTASSTTRPSGRADAGTAVSDGDTGSPGILCDCPAEVNPCLLAVCLGGVTLCTLIPQPGAACDDGNPCTVSDQCDALGVCGGEPKDCSSEDGVCYEGVCNEDSGKCEAKPSAAKTACNDGDKCTRDDVCDGKGACVGKALDCSSLDSSCTEGTCDADTGECVAKPSNEGKTCNDGDNCTQDDVCKGGVCGGQAVDCSDKDGACTTGVCDPKNGNCKAEPLSNIACDDGDACTAFDACDNGKCKGKKADNCSDTGVLELSSGSTSVTMSNSCARDDFDVRSRVPKGSDCVRSAGNDVVFLLDLSDFDEEVTLRASTNNNDTKFDTVLYLMKQQCSKDPPIACVDDVGTSLSAELEVKLEPGVYALVVDSYRGNERGIFRLDVDVH